LILSLDPHVHRVLTTDDVEGATRKELTDALRRVVRYLPIFARLLSGICQTLLSFRELPRIAQDSQDAARNEINMHNSEKFPFSLEELQLFFDSVLLLSFS
jgi:hypothetical protein